MLSDEDLRHIDEGRFRAGVGFFTREEMRDFYERCIENGTLRVVETRVGDDITTARANFCPGCGANLK